MTLIMALIHGILLLDVGVISLVLRPFLRTRGSIIIIHIVRGLGWFWEPLVPVLVYLNVIIWHGCFWAIGWSGSGPAVALRSITLLRWHCVVVRWPSLLRLVLVAGLLLLKSCFRLPFLNAVGLIIGFVLGGEGVARVKHWVWCLGCLHLIAMLSVGVGVSRCWYWHWTLAILGIVAFDLRIALSVSRDFSVRCILSIRRWAGPDRSTFLRVVAMSVDLEVLLLSCSLALSIANQLVLFLWSDLMRILLALLEAWECKPSLVLGWDQWHHFFALGISLHIVLEVSFLDSSLGKLNFLAWHAHCRLKELVVSAHLVLLLMWIEGGVHGLSNCICKQGVARVAGLRKSQLAWSLAAVGFRGNSQFLVEVHSFCYSQINLF